MKERKKNGCTFPAYSSYGQPFTSQCHLSGGLATWQDGLATDFNTFNVEAMARGYFTKMAVLLVVGGAAAMSESDYQPCRADCSGCYV